MITEPKTEIVHISTPKAYYTLDFNSRTIRAKPIITNADRIRSMSDEEFATAICKHDGCPFRKTEDNECLKHYYDCKVCWIDWLKQEDERW